MPPESKPTRTAFKSHKMPAKSVFYDRIVPALFIVLGVVMLSLILFAIGVLTGVIPWK